jgi:hypothetical protein
MRNWILIIVMIRIWNDFYYLLKHNGIYRKDFQLENG